ncbi:restriction endonuclease subunit S [Bifidobacterium adolescentis]|nr:restriction endonuclease subunit S [Bifidobacterium adolescentis]KAB5923031.1 restriction endonuclease subunit S [Bifidobacterium adolescentis]KAB5925809.1 restriction endonuclease subunit S [Bifidobacterium adolescentis]KAB5927429.1 restriction endonuclease subunit S [Bifidobacterium adolescentis]KAB5929502.1 restriction endonuclease subunit S [Bifidobacterium adolescentis]
MLAIWRVWKSSKHCSGVNDMAEQHEKALVPQIRFTGFTDPWEQRKLGEVASGFEYGLNAAASDFDGEKKYLRITDIDDQTREFRTDDLSSPDINNPIDDRYLLKEGDILFARTGASVGKTYLYKASDGKTYYAGFLIRAHVSDEADAGFIFQSTLTERYKQFVLLTSQRSGQPGINAQEYSDLLLPLPSLMEQRRIGAFFDHLDSLITLHQRKYDKLCVLKKSMLDKMFPKGGSLYPEIRFAGFTDPWEQRKLSSTCEQLSRTINPLETPNEEFTEYSMPAFDNNETAETVIGNSMNSLRKIVDRPCLLVNKLNVRKKRIWHVPRPEANAVCSSEFVPFSSHSSDLSFIKISLLSERITAYLESCSSGSSNSQKRVTPEIIMSSEIIAPSLAEQRRIGAFFDRLDSLITLHQRKLELLRNIKKSMLDKMFV